MKNLLKIITAQILYIIGKVNLKIGYMNKNKRIKGFSKKFTKLNKKSLKERNDINFFIAMMGLTSNNCKVIKKKITFGHSFKGFLNRIRTGNIHTLATYDNLNLEKYDNKFSDNTYRSLEQSYKMYLGYSEKNHSKQSFEDYIKEYFNYLYIYFYKLIIHSKNYEEFKLIENLISAPKFLFCPNINKIVLGNYFNLNVTNLIKEEEFKSLKNHFKNNKLNSSNNKFNSFIKLNLLSNKSLIWNYSGTFSKLENDDFLQDYEDSIFLESFPNKSFLKSLQTIVETL